MASVGVAAILVNEGRCRVAFLCKRGGVVASPDLVMAGSYDYRPWADERTNAGDGWLRSYRRDSGKRKVERCAHPNQCDDRQRLEGR